jgi:hypothetical protein
MTSSITVGDHEVKVGQGDYEDFDDDGNPITRATGRSTRWCTRGTRGAGPNAETTRQIRDHLGIDENGEVRDRGE